jgi:hypothetical protein
MGVLEEHATPGGMSQGTRRRGDEETMILRCQGLLASSRIVQISIERFIYYTPDNQYDTMV